MRPVKSGLGHGTAPAAQAPVKTFLCAFCTALIAALAFYFLTLREISAIDPKGPGAATIKQLKQMNEIALKDSGAATTNQISQTAFKDSEAPTTNQLKEISQTARKDPGVRASRQLGRSQRRRELESAITRAERALTDAQEASEED